MKSRKRLLRGALALLLVALAITVTACGPLRGEVRSKSYEPGYSERYRYSCGSDNHRTCWGTRHHSECFKIVLTTGEARCVQRNQWERANPGESFDSDQR